MSDCHSCARHRPDADGGCTAACRHREAATGTNACPPCAQRLRDDLDALATAWDATAAGPVTTAAGAGGAIGVPGGVAWVDWRHGGEVIGVLSSWARVIHEDAQAEGVELPWPLLTVPVLVAWHRAALERWTLAHEALAEVMAEIGALAAVARRMVGEVPTGQVVACPAPSDGDSGSCGRRLRVHAADPEAEVRCDRCGTTWSTSRLLLLGMGSGDVWADVEAVASFVGVSEASIRRWARAGRVRRQGARYSVTDVRAVQLDSARV